MKLNRELLSLQQQIEYLDEFVAIISDSHKIDNAIKVMEVIRQAPPYLLENYNPEQKSYDTASNKIYIKKDPENPNNILYWVGMAKNPESMEYKIENLLDKIGQKAPRDMINQLKNPPKQSQRSYTTLLGNKNEAGEEIVFFDNEGELIEQKKAIEDTINFFNTDRYNSTVFANNFNVKNANLSHKERLIIAAVNFDGEVERQITLAAPFSEPDVQISRIRLPKALGHSAYGEH